MPIRLRLRTFRTPFLAAILLVSWLRLSSLKIVSDKILQSQESAGQFWDQIEAKLRQNRQILSIFPLHLHLPFGCGTFYATIGAGLSGRSSV
jgi:hypothetical protein